MGEREPCSRVFDGLTDGGSRLAFPSRILVEHRSGGAVRAGVNNTDVLKKLRLHVVGAAATLFVGPAGFGG